MQEVFAGGVNVSRITGSVANGIPLDRLRDGPHIQSGPKTSRSLLRLGEVHSLVQELFNDRPRPAETDWKNVAAADLRTRIGLRSAAGRRRVAIILFSPFDKFSMQETCSRIITYSSAGIPFNGQTLQVGNSVGVALYPNDGQSEESLYETSDSALFVAKRTQSSYSFMSPAAVDRDLTALKLMDVPIAELTT